MSNFRSPPASLFPWKRTVPSPELCCSSDFNNALLNAKREVMRQFLIIRACWVHFTHWRSRWSWTSVTVAWWICTLKIFFFCDTQKRWKAARAWKTNIAKIRALCSHIEITYFVCRTLNLKTLKRAAVYKDSKFNSISSVDSFFPRSGLNVTDLLIVA